MSRAAARKEPAMVAREKEAAVAAAALVVAVAAVAAVQWQGHHSNGHISVGFTSSHLSDLASF